MNNEIFLCAYCAEIFLETTEAEELPNNTFANDKCSMCHKQRFGCKYIRQVR